MSKRKEDNRSLSQAERELAKLFKSTNSVNLPGPNTEFRKERIEEHRQLDGDSSLFVAFEEPYLNGVNNMVQILNELPRDHDINTTEQLLEADIVKISKKGNKTNELLTAMQNVLKERTDTHK